MSPTAPTQTDTNSRKRLFLMLGAAVVVAALGYGLYWFFIGSHEVSTDDAYVQADTADVTPAIDGIVQDVKVIDTQIVSPGDVLVTLDATDAQLALDNATAKFASAQADTTRAQIDLGRRQALAASGSVSAEELTNARNSLLTAQANLAAAQAMQNQASVDLSRTTITSPVAGVIARRQVQVGQHVKSGDPMMTVVPLGAVYVNANFKEVQLRHVRIGQPVELESDLYGSAVTYHGTVSGLPGGTGSAFAIIPAQNATGNWIKVVQRLPVRIALNPQELATHPLQVGLSMAATIDISK